MNTENQDAPETLSTLANRLRLLADEAEAKQSQLEDAGTLAATIVVNVEKGFIFGTAEANGVLATIARRILAERGRSAKAEPFTAPHLVPAKEVCDAIRAQLKRASAGQYQTWGFVALFEQMIEKVEKQYGA